MGAVKKRMTLAELDPSIMDLDPERSVVSQLKENITESSLKVCL